MPRHSNIKPYKGRTKKLGEGLVRLDNTLLNEIGQFCVNQYLLLNEYNQNNCNRNMKNKKIVRLTENQLHNIIAESVSQILTEMVDEGQGWDFFKDIRNSYRNSKNKQEDLNYYNQNKNTKEFQQAKKNFINTGDEEGYGGHDLNGNRVNPNIYSKTNPLSGRYESDADNILKNDGDNYGKVNNSWRGKLGRRAGMAAAQGYLGFQNLKNKFRGI